MMKALSVRMDSVEACLERSRAVVMAASLALLMVYLSGCDMISTWVEALVFGSTMDAPKVGLLVICEPSV